MNSKTIKSGIITLVVIIAIYVVFHYGSEWIDQARERRKIKDLDGRINKNNLSYGETQYTSFAKKLFAAMDGLFTDEDAIYDVFRKMKNIDDLLMLQVAFSEVEDENESLEDWLHDDLSNSEIRVINSILEERQITYSF
ncbi:MAG: hypothetical protein MJ198_05095 [Bacteroidales bacterium]|nr:hypothetical protein [Bacteroidales bacterium]